MTDSWKKLYWHRNATEEKRTLQSKLFPCLSTLETVPLFVVPSSMAVPILMNNFIHFKSLLDAGYDAVRIYYRKAVCTDLGQEICPYCGHVGCSGHGSYWRQCRDISGGEIVTRHFRMLRARCRECGRTHAVRCGIFAAYKRYCSALIREICSAARRAAVSINRICDSIPLCPRTVSRWKSISRSVPEDTRLPVRKPGTDIVI